MAFQKFNFRICSFCFSHRKVMGYYFHRPDLLPPCTLPYAFKKMFLQKILQITIDQKSENFMVIVSKMRLLGQKKLQGRGAKQVPPLV